MGAPFKVLPTMTEAEAQAAENGTCPGCKAKRLGLVNSGEGMRFFQCYGCSHITVLGIEDAVKARLAKIIDAEFQAQEAAAKARSTPVGQLSFLTTVPT